MPADSERPRLREFRVQAGWTQQQLADRLAHVAWMELREHVAVNADMVAKWERGVKGISPRYRELLCGLFGVTADQLGLKNTPTPVGAPELPSGGDESLVGLLDNAAQLLDQLGAAGSALAPHMLHAWKESVTTRRTLLGLLDPARTDPAGHARAATASIEELEQLADRYETLYDTADPSTLLTPVVAHLRMTASALGRGPVREQRRRLLRNQARVGLIAGRLAAEDLGDRMSGRAYFGLAGDAAREAGDERLFALAQGCSAQLAAAEGMTTTALDHLATALNRGGADPAVRSWLSAIAAAIHADRGELDDARQALDRAHAACSGGTPTGGVLAAELAVMTGRVLVGAHDYGRARAGLIAALGQVSRTARRPRVLMLVELAFIELRLCDPPAACSRATEAAELLRQVPYALGRDRLRAFREVAARPLPRQALRVLDSHLSGIAA